LENQPSWGDIKMTIENRSDTGAGGAPLVITSPPPGSSKRTRTSRLALALMVAGILVIAAVAAAVTFGWGPFARPSPSAQTGPGVQISIDPVPLADIARAAKMPMTVLFGAVEVQIFASVPSAASFVDQPAVSHVESLFAGSPDSSGVVAGSLSTQFYTVNSETKLLMSSMTTSVSLQLFATLIVVSNGTGQVYTYSNNLAYNPNSPPPVFRSNVTFGAQPTFSVPVVNSSIAQPSASPDRGIGGGGCNPGYQWNPIGVTFANDIDLPVATLNVENAPSGSAVSFDIDYFAGSFSMSFNSNTAYTTTSGLSGVQMSSNPSWSGDDASFSGENPSSFVANSPGYSPVAMIDLTGVDLEVVNYEWEYLNNQCSETLYDSYMTNFIPDGMSSSSYSFATPALPSFFPSVLNSMKLWGEFTTQTLPYAGGPFSLYSVMYGATGYSGAVNAYSGVESFLSSLAAGIGLMLAASVALGLLPGEGDANAAACTAVLASIADYSAGFLTSVNSISFSTTVTTSIEQFSIDQPGSGTDNGPLTAQINAENTGTELSLSSGTYYPDLPLVYVVVT
jgi:hypothetical protein